MKHCGAPQLKSAAGVDQQLKKRGAPPFLFDAALEAKLASLSKEAANQTAINSLYNQFMGISGKCLSGSFFLFTFSNHFINISPIHPGNAAIISNAANSATATVGRDFGSGGGGGNRRSFESGSSSFSSHHRRSPSNERHQSASWMSAVADAAATGVPLFVPVPSPTHIGGNAIGGQGAKLGAGGGAGNVASYEQYSHHHHHQQQYYQNQNHSQQALVSEFFFFSTPPLICPLICDPFLLLFSSFRTKAARLFSPFLIGATRCSSSSSRTTPVAIIIISSSS